MLDHVQARALRGIAPARGRGASFASTARTFRPIYERLVRLPDIDVFVSGGQDASGNDGPPVSARDRRTGRYGTLDVRLDRIPREARPQ